jgi:membrane-associated phospholipid phosphatase
MEIIRHLRAWVNHHLGLTVVLVLVFGLLCLFLFADLAEDVFSNDEIVTIDLLLANDLHSRGTVTTTAVMKFISFFGSQVVFVFSAVAGLYYAWRRKWLRVTLWALAIAGGELLNLALKYVFDRPRPSFADPFTVEQFNSFPSGHAMMSFIAYGLLAYFICVSIQNRRARIVVVFCAIMIVVLIGISRMYLGAHYLSDVVSGFLIGGVWLAICVSIREYIRHRTSISTAVAA